MKHFHAYLISWVVIDAVRITSCCKLAVQVIAQKLTHATTDTKPAKCVQQVSNGDPFLLPQVLQQRRSGTTTSQLSEVDDSVVS